MNLRSPSDPWIDRLSELLDGELDASERVACEEHLEGCAECERTLSELTAVRAAARALPVVPPARDLWQAIAPRLTARVLDARPRLSLAERFTRRWSLSGGQLAAAAAALVAGTAMVVWLVAGRGTPDRGATAPTLAALPRSASPAPSLTPPAAEPAGPRGGPAASAPATAAPAPRAAEPPSQVADFGVDRYDAAVAELEAALRSNRSKLDPRTVRIVEANLEVIDRAIGDARSALARDPASPYLNAYLASTMRRKVGLLRRVNTLAGNPI
jgi:anti-sigma factor RsiW